MVSPSSGERGINPPGFDLPPLPQGEGRGEGRFNRQTVYLIGG